MAIWKFERHEAGIYGIVLRERAHRRTDDITQDLQAKCYFFSHLCVYGGAHGEGQPDLMTQ